MSDFYDDKETRSASEREEALFAHLRTNLAATLKGSAGWQNFLQGVDPQDLTDRNSLAKLPVLRKSDLQEMQAKNPPLAGFALGTAENFGRLFMSPGPIFEPMGSDADPWHGARALHAAGFRKGDVVHNTFSYHLTPGGFILDNAARTLGCAVIPAGTGNSEQQVQAIEQLKPRGYTGTPDYLKILLDKADEVGRDASCLQVALVSGGALFPSQRAEYAERGIQVKQCYATADVGVIAYESSAMDGLIVNENKIVEIVTPGTGTPVADGEVGEVVVTSFNAGYPMIRLATGDLSAVLDGQSPCGRTNTRLKGWMGRADQTAKVKGMFIRPTQIARIAQKHPELSRLRLVISRKEDRDDMVLMAECASADDGLSQKAVQTLQDQTKVRGTVQICAPGTLPNDGKVISDERDYDN